LVAVSLSVAGTVEERKVRKKLGSLWHILVPNVFTNYAILIVLCFRLLDPLPGSTPSHILCQPSPLALCLLSLTSVSIYRSPKL
jgi:hypothetical protein